MFLNGQPIIADRMPKGTSADATVAKRVPLVAVAERAGKHTTHSASIRLMKKQKYRLRVEFVHNTHFLVDAADSGNIQWVFFSKLNGKSASHLYADVFRLLWASEDIPGEAIPSKFFFTANHPLPIKVSGYELKSPFVAFLCCIHQLVPFQPGPKLVPPLFALRWGPGVFR